MWICQQRTKRKFRKNKKQQQFNEVTKEASQGKAETKRKKKKKKKDDAPRETATAMKVNKKPEAVISHKTKLDKTAT